MQIDITALDKGVNKLELSGDAESLELTEDEVRLDSPVVAELTLNVFNEDIKIDGVVRAEAVEECSRCLETFIREVEAEVHLYAVPAGRVSGAGRSEEDEEPEPGDGYLAHDGRELDLSEEVRSAILLATPMKPLCKPDCKGLCPECGGNLNQNQCSCGARKVDPRWSALDKLRGR